MAEWFFDEHPEGTRRREPLVGEFFATESISNVVSALVREFVQNSMDAALEPNSRVEVHFSLGQLSAGSQTDKYFRSFWDHYKACEDRSGRGKRPDLSQTACRYLLAEDFDTTGLRGDPSVPFIDTGVEVDETNDFYYFIRTEGASGKSTTDRGNWGVGKYTYAKTSNINSFFAFSVRNNPGGSASTDQVLIGQSILNYHLIDGVVFQPDGWWGTRGGNGGAMPMPFVDSDPQTADFQEDFKLFRSSEPGLSIVVPFVAPDIDAAALMTAVLRNYLAPIVRGQLSVVIRGENDELYELSADTIHQEVQEFDPALWDEFGPEIELVRWWHDNHTKDDPNGFFTLPKPPQKDQLSWEHRVDEEMASAIRERIENAEMVSVRVPIAIQGTKQNDQVEWSFVDLLLCPDPDQTLPPTFYREGIRISEVKSDRIPGMRAVVLADDNAVTGFLGAAEGPAHTDWQSSRERFSGSYRTGRNLLAFVKALPSRMVNRVRSGEDDTDLGVALDFFSIPADEGRPGSNRRADTEASEEETEVMPPQPPPTSSPRRLTLGDLDGGFTVTAGDGLAAGSRVIADVAFDTLRGDPLRNWIREDFDLASGPISIDLDGAELIEGSQNHLEVRVLDPGSFRVTVKGFDRNRDIFVRTRVVA